MGAFITRNYNACILSSWREHAKRRRSENTPFRGVVWARNEGNYMHAIRKQKGHYTSTGRGGIQFTNPFPFNFYETQRRPWRIVCTGAWQVKNKNPFSPVWSYLAGATAAFSICEKCTFGRQTVTHRFHSIEHTANYFSPFPIRH